MRKLNFEQAKKLYDFLRVQLSIRFILLINLKNAGYHWHFNIYWFDGINLNEFSDSDLL